MADESLYKIALKHAWLFLTKKMIDNEYGHLWMQIQISPKVGGKFYDKNIQSLPDSQRMG